MDEQIRPVTWDDVQKAFKRNCRIHGSVCAKCTFREGDEALPDNCGLGQASYDKPSDCPALAEGA